MKCCMPVCCRRPRATGTRWHWLYGDICKDCYKKVCPPKVRPRPSWLKPIKPPIEAIDGGRMG